MPNKGFMRTIVNYTFSKVTTVMSKLTVEVRSRYFRAINKFLKRPKILIFTDSRGFEITKIWNRRNPYSSYVGAINRNYECVVKICPEKFTSILDFLDFYDSVRDRDFDKIILHCGIVDFAPRPESSFDMMYKTKIQKIKKYNLEIYVDKANRDFGEIYYGEKTISFLNRDAIINVLLPLLQSIPNLVYIGVNPVLTDWNGSYWRRRPANINDQLLLDAILLNGLQEVIDLSSLSKDEVKMYTSDNVHYTREGFSYIYKMLKSLMPKI